MAIGKSFTDCFWPHYVRQTISRPMTALNFKADSSHRITIFLGSLCDPNRPSGVRKNSRSTLGVTGMPYKLRQCGVDGWVRSHL